MNDYFEKIEQMRKDRRELHPVYQKKLKTYKAFLELEKIACGEGVLQKKIKELMALAISIVTKCEPCMEWHVQQALLAGASDEEIFETIDVAVEMGGGPAHAYSRYALRALEYHKQKRKISNTK